MATKSKEIWGIVDSEGDLVWPHIPDMPRPNVVGNMLRREAVTPVTVTWEVPNED